MIPSIPRLPGAPTLIERGMYFAVHAPRSTGKATARIALAAGGLQPVEDRRGRISQDFRQIWPQQVVW